MIRWQCSIVVLILVINSLQFGNGSQEFVKCSTSDDSCDLPCVDKVTDRIFKLLGEQYAKHELGIVEKVERQIAQIERIIEERIAKIETLLTGQISSCAGNPHEYKESSKEIHKVEQNTVQRDLVAAEPKNDTTLEPITSTSTFIEEVTNYPALSVTPNDCINGEPSYYDEDYGQQFIEARHGSDQLKRCSETVIVTSEIPPSTSSATINNGSKDPNGTVTVPSISEKPFSPNEESEIEDNDEDSTAVFRENFSTTMKSAFPKPADNEEDAPKVIPGTTAETGGSIHQELEQQIFVPVFPDVDTSTTKKYEHELLKITIPPKKKIQLFTRKSTTTEDPNRYKIHFPTESPDEIVTTPTPPKQVPKPPQVFRYSQKFLNGSWTIIHSRFNGMISFNRSWSEYRTPFGRLPGEYWAGLEAIHQLTKSGDYELLILLKGFDGSVKTALYDSFWVGSEVTNYRLALGPFVSGDAGDSLSGSSGQMFSTYDRDNDRSLCASCGQLYHSGWWFKDCGDANLNGLYTSSVEKDEKSYGLSMNWWSFGRDYQGLQEAAMMVRKRARKLF